MQFTHYIKRQKYTFYLYLIRGGGIFYYIFEKWFIAYRQYRKELKVRLNSNTTVDRPHSSSPPTILHSFCIKKGAAPRHALYSAFSIHNSAFRPALLAVADATDG
jgi:hypothetical protein